MLEPGLVGSSGPVSVVTTVAGSGEVVVVQYLDSSGNPTNVLGYVPNVQDTVEVHGASGTFTLTFGGQTTSAIPIGAPASVVQTALQSLSSVGSGNMTVIGQFPYVITFGAGISGPITVATGGLSASAAATPTTTGTGNNQFLDSISTGSSQSGSAWILNSSGVYHYAVATGTGLNSATWTFSGLAPGNYQICFAIPHVTVSPVSTTTPLRFFDGSTYLGMDVISQASAPYFTLLSGSSFSFQAIRTLYVGSGSLTILLTDEVSSGDVGKYVVADVFAVAPLNPAATQVIANSTNPSVAFPVGTGFPHTYNPGSAGWNQSEQYTYSAGDQYKWVFPGLLPGTYSFQVSYAWYSSQRSAMASYQVYDNGVAVGSPVVVSQLVAPSGGLTLTDPHNDSIAFEKLGNFTVKGPVVTLVLTAGADTTNGVATNANAALVSLQSVSGLLGICVGSGGFILDRSTLNQYQQWNPHRPDLADLVHPF